MPLASHLASIKGEGNAGKVFQVLTRKPGDLPSRKYPCRRGVRKSGISGWRNHASLYQSRIPVVKYIVCGPAVFAVRPRLKARGRAGRGVTMSTNLNTANSAVSVKTASVAQSLTAIVLGLFVVGFVGFSHVEAVHNAAHDTRHANAFPCH